MTFAPKQNWPEYHALVEPKQIEKDRLLSASQKARQYAEIFDSVWSLRTAVPQSVLSCEDEKLKARARCLLAYRKVQGINCD